MAWTEELALYDEPHGDEYFVIDYTERPPVWYRLNGEVFGRPLDGQVVRRPEEVLSAIQMRGWNILN